MATLAPEIAAPVLALVTLPLMFPVVGTSAKSWVDVTPAVTFTDAGGLAVKPLFEAVRLYELLPTIE